MAFGKRLRELRLKKDLTQADLAKIIGLGESTISFYESNKRQPDYEILTKLATFFNVSTDYLLGRTDIREVNTVEGPRLREEFLRIMKDQRGSLPSSTIIKAINKMLPSEKNKPRVLPILGSIRAGLPILADEHIEDMLEIPDYIKADYILRIQGDSMLGVGILDGDLAICKETQVAQAGQIVVALRDEATGFSEATLKYFFNGSRNGPLLRAANPQYEDIDMEEGYRIAGVMVALIREDTPSYQVYRNYLTTKDDEEWTEIIEKASAYGISPEQLSYNLDMQWQMVEKMKDSKTK